MYRASKEYAVASDIHRNAEGEVIAYNPYNSSIVTTLKVAEGILKAAKQLCPKVEWHIIEREVSAWKKVS